MQTAYDSLDIFADLLQHSKITGTSLEIFTYDSEIGVNVSGNPGDGGGGGGGEYHTFDTDGKLTQLGYGLFIFFRSMFKLQKI